MPYFRIAGVGFQIRVSGGDNIDLQALETFKCRKIAAPDSVVSFRTERSLPRKGDLLFEEGGLSWRRNNGYTEAAVRKEDEDMPCALLRADRLWSRINIGAVASASKPGVLKTLGEIAFRTTLLFHNGLVMHASAVQWEGRGIVFSAPSNTGKTTQADLWKEKMGAVVLNGDRPALRTISGRTFVFGTPWSGSSRDFKNDRASLSAIVVLKQEKNNRIRRLPLDEAAAMLVPRCFLPYWDKGMMERALANLEVIILNTPVFLLECRPDTGAVELVKQCV